MKKIPKIDIFILQRLQTLLTRNVDVRLKPRFVRRSHISGSCAVSEKGNNPSERARATEREVLR